MTLEYKLYADGPFGDVEDLYKITITEDQYEKATESLETLDGKDSYDVLDVDATHFGNDTYELYPKLVVVEDKRVVLARRKGTVARLSGTYDDPELPVPDDFWGILDESFSLAADLSLHPDVWFSDRVVQFTLATQHHDPKIGRDKFIARFVDDEDIDAFDQKRELVVAHSSAYSLPSGEDHTEGSTTGSPPSEADIAAEIQSALDDWDPDLSIEDLSLGYDPNISDMLEHRRKVFWHLAEHPGRALTADDLLDQLYVIPARNDPNRSELSAEATSELRQELVKPVLEQGKKNGIIHQVDTDKYQWSGPRVSYYDQ